MACQKCFSDRVLSFSGKCDDRFGCQLGSKELNDYPPRINGLCGSDYISGKVCLDCGQLQGRWPVLQIEELGEVDEDE